MYEVQIKSFILLYLNENKQSLKTTTKVLKKVYSSLLTNRIVLVHSFIKCILNKLEDSR